MKINLKKTLAALFAGALLFGALTGCNFGTNNGALNYADVGDFEVSDNPVTMVNNMAIGWNLGNAFDASGCGVYDYQNAANGTLEYSWLPQGVNSKTSKKLIQAVRAAGFKTIRIPISWHNYMSKTDTSYTISSTYMNRVKEVVDWALEEKMCVIINIHHDNLSVKSSDDVALTAKFIAESGDVSQIDDNPGFALSKNADVQAKSKAYIKAVWEQISEAFKDYDNNVVFELLNEPRCIGTELEWGFYGDNASKAKAYCDIITSYEQVALNAIRASGGKNATRYLSAPGYAASPDYLSSYTLPKDTVENRLLLAVHAYTPGGFALAGDFTDFDAYRNPYGSNATAKQEIDEVFNTLKTKYINKGIGVVMGEASASDKNNLSSRLKWAEYYFKAAQAAGIPVILWDNEIVATDSSDKGGENHGYFNRKTGAQTCPKMIETMMKAVYGDDFGKTGEEDNPDDPVTPPASDEVVIFDAAKDSISVGSVEEINGVKYLKYTPVGYSNFELPSPVSVSGKTRIYVTARAGENSSDYQMTIQCVDNSNSKWVPMFGTAVGGDGKEYNVSITFNPCSTTPSEKSEAIKAGTKVTHISAAIQNISDNYSATKDKTIYISKIVAK